VIGRPYKQNVPLNKYTNTSQTAINIYKNNNIKNDRTSIEWHTPPLLQQLNKDGIIDICSFTSFCENLLKLVGL
jgi:hypothetical protein